jgi:hypothetical protein
MAERLKFHILSANRGGVVGLITERVTTGDILAHR